MFSYKLMSVRILIVFCALYGAIENKDVAVYRRFC